MGNWCCSVTSFAKSWTTASLNRLNYIWWTMSRENKGSFFPLIAVDIVQECVSYFKYETPLKLCIFLRDAKGKFWQRVSPGALVGVFRAVRAPAAGGAPVRPAALPIPWAVWAVALVVSFAARTAPPSSMSPSIHWPTSLCCARPAGTEPNSCRRRRWTNGSQSRTSWHKWNSPGRRLCRSGTWIWNLSPVRIKHDCNH